MERQATHNELILKFLRFLQGSDDLLFLFARLLEMSDFIQRGFLCRHGGKRLVIRLGFLRRIERHNQP
jgi:hypothetical protein